MTIEKMDSLEKLYKTGKIGPNYQNKISRLFPRLRAEKVALVGQRKSLKSPQPPFVKGGRGGIYREGAGYFLLTNMLVLVAQ